MAGFRERVRKRFPLTGIASVVELFRDQLEGKEEPNLAFLSVTLGYVENVLTLSRSVVTQEQASLLQPIFPAVDFDAIDALYTKFETLVKGSVDPSKYSMKYSSRDLVKKISDVVWASLSRSFKDRAHLQSLFSLLTGNKLDCFGVALGVVAAAQLLSCHDIHLALSEDHAWVVFGEDGTDTAEVTWHGKGNEDKRGQSIALSVAEKSWLYLNGHPVICDRNMEVAAIVSAANPCINVSVDSLEMGTLQQELLWLLYDKGILEKYPMALENLGDLEEISPSPGRPPPLMIFKKAVDSAVTFYENHFVYPYTYLGGYLYRKRHYKEAIKCWAEASNVIRKFNYTRDDEEIYKEFLEIANEMLPNLVKTVSLGTDHGQVSILYNPEVYADILRFYDGICEWEEGSSTPVLHVGWAQNLTFSLSKFDPRARAKIDVGKDEDEDKEEDDEENDGSEDKGKIENNGNTEHTKQIDIIEKNLRQKSEVKEQEQDGEEIYSETLTACDPLRVIIKDLAKEDLQMLSPQSQSSSQRVTARGRKGQRRRFSNSSTRDGSQSDTSGEVRKKMNLGEHFKCQQRNQMTIEELASKIGQHDDYLDSATNPTITALAQQCSLNILNKEYLFGSGEPFSSSLTGPHDDSFSTTPIPSNHFSGSDPRLDVDEFLSSKSNGTAFIGLTMDSMLKAESPADMMMTVKRSDDATCSLPIPSPSPSPISDILAAMEPIHVELHSEKMKGLKKMFQSAKLNAGAIKLQLTAQSQVHVKDSRFLEFCEPMGSARKRPRREII